MISLRYAAFSDVGLLRPSNQDAGYASANLLAIADGMGGAAGGDIASSVVIGHLAQIDDVHPAEDLLPLLHKTLEEAHEDLISIAAEHSELAGLGTTCIAILRSENKLGMIHIGDSRAYLLREGKLTQITHDHTLVQYLVDRGELTAQEAENHPKRNVIMKNVGDSPEPLQPDDSVREAVAGDRWLLASDGLFGVVSNESIEATLIEHQDLESCGHQLIDLALAGGAPDNVTVVLADVVSGEGRDGGEIVVGSAAVDAGKPTRGGNSAAGKLAKLRQELGISGGGAGARAGVAGGVGASAAGGTGAGNGVPGRAAGGDAGTAGGSASVTSGSAGRAARVAGAGHDGAFAGQSSEEFELDEPKRSRIPRIAAVVGVVLLALAAVAGGWTWSQHQYYVSISDGNVAIFRGVPLKLGPIDFSQVEERTDIALDQLAPVAQARLDDPITRGSLEEARLVVADLAAHEASEVTVSPTPSSPTPTPSASPSTGSSPSTSSSPSSSSSPSTGTSETP